MVELKSFSALPKSTSVEIQTHISSTNFNNNGKLKINFISHSSDQSGYIDVGGGCWRSNMLVIPNHHQISVTNIKFWRIFWQCW